MSATSDGGSNSNGGGGDGASGAANNALQITGSIVSILTFIYALGVGLYFYAKTAASSPQEINEFIISLQFSYEEMQRFAHSYANYRRERTDPDTDPNTASAASAPPSDSELASREAKEKEKEEARGTDPRPGTMAEVHEAAAADAEAQALAAKAYLIEGHTASRLESLRQLALKVGTMASDGFFRQWSNRVRYVMLQEELSKQVAGKDRLMEELRRVQESFDKAAEDKRQRRHEALLERQIDLLQRLARRVDELEHRSKENSNSAHLSVSEVDSGFNSRAGDDHDHDDGNDTLSTDLKVA